MSFARIRQAFWLCRSKLPESMKLNDIIITDSVPAMSANRLVFDYDLKKTDVVVIDAEGYDWVILKGLLEARLRPSLIYFESKFLDQEESQAALSTLQSHGYSILRMGSNTAAHWNPHLVKRDALENIK